MNKTPVILNISFAIDTRGVWFSEFEMDFLNNWYKYYRDLLDGKIKHETNAQKIFINIFNEKIKKNSIPITFHSKTYQSLNLYQKTLIRYYYIDLYKGKIWDYINTQGSDSIYYLSKAQLTFAKKIKLPYKLKNADHYIKVIKKKNKL